MSTAVVNPFIVKEIERLATVRDLEIFLSHKASAKKTELDRLQASGKTHGAAAAKADLKQLETACVEAYGCDPWKYEPVLLDTLVALRESGASDKEVDRIRGLIRAGSWMQYPRMDEDAILEDIRRLRRTVPKYKDARLAHAEELFSQRVVGPALRPAVITIEDLSLHAWLMLKKTAHADGVGPTDGGVHLRALQNEIAELRAIRDALYFRLLYPVIASKGFA